MHAHPLCSRLHRPRRPPRAGGPVRPDACGDHPRPGGGHSARRLPHTRRAGPAALRLAAAPFHASWKCSTPGMPRFMSSSGSSVQATAALCPRLQTCSTDKGLDSQGSAHRCRQTCCCSPWTSTRAGAHPVLRNTPRRQAHAAALWAVLCALNQSACICLTLLCDKCASGVRAGTSRITLATGHKRLVTSGYCNTFCCQSQALACIACLCEPNDGCGLSA